MSSKLGALFRPFTRCCGTPSEPRPPRAAGKAVDVGQAQASSKVAEDKFSDAKATEDKVSDAKAADAKADAKATGRASDGVPDADLQKPRADARPRVASVPEGTTPTHPPSDIPHAPDNPFEPAAEPPVAAPSVAAPSSTETATTKTSTTETSDATVVSQPATEPSPALPASEPSPASSGEHFEDALEVHPSAATDEPFLGPEPGDSVAGVPTNAQPEPVSKRA